MKSLSVAATAGLLLVSTLFGIAWSPGCAGAHLSEKLIGETPSDPSEWNYHGIGPEEASRWIAEGIIFAAWADQWRKEGFNPRSAGQWHEITNVSTAGDFLRHGFSPEEASEWIRHGIRSGQRAWEYLSAGLDAQEAATFWSKGLFPDDAKKWRDAGFSAAEMLRWRYGPRQGDFYLTSDKPCSRTVYDSDFARKWRDAGFRPEEAHRAGAYGLELAEMQDWQAAGFSFRETVSWKDSEFDLEEAAGNRNAGLSHVEAELRRYETSAREDEITELSLDVTVRGDGTLRVEENVAFIDRPWGAYRDGFYKFPSPFQVQSVRVNGVAGEAVMAGNALHFKGSDGILGEGEHLVALVYNTGHMVQNGPHLDELRFDIIPAVLHGNYVRAASATIRLPKGAHLIFADGKAGFPEREDFVAEVEESGEGDIIRYVATRPLRPNMGFSVHLGFVKGYATAPWLHQFGELDRRSRRFLSSLGIFASGLALSLLYYWIAWVRVGRDPKGRGAPLSQFSPPDGIEPPRMRALLGKRGKEHLNAAAELLSLAGRGFLRISEREGVYKIEGTGKAGGDLPSWENDFLVAILQDRGRLILTGRAGRKQLSSGSRQLKTALAGEYRAHSEQNTRYLAPGVLLALLFLAASLAIIDVERVLYNDHGGLLLALYAGFLTAAFGFPTLLFARLLRRPSRDLVLLLERLKAYGEFLERNFAGLSASPQLPPLLQKHLPYAIAAGIEVDFLTIRGGEARWYQGASGGFGCGDFITMVKRSL